MEASPSHPNPRLTRALSQSQDPQVKYDLTIADLQHEHPRWVDYHRRVERSGGNDANLNEFYRLINNRMDFLLGDLYRCMGKLGVEDGA